MRIEEHTNWVAGQAVPPAAEELFESAGHLEPGAPTGRWPRSSAADLLAALEQTARAAEVWRGRPRSERLALLRKLPAALARQPGLAEDLGRALGLQPHELASRFEQDLFSLAESLEIAADAETEEPPGAGLFVAHWSDLVGGLAGRICARLLGGAGVCILSDPHLPAAAEALGRALEETVGPGPWSIVHTDLPGPLAAALQWEDLAWLRWRAPRETLMRALDYRRGCPATWQLWPLANSSHVVLEDADPHAEANLVMQQALGRSGTLSGQFPGQVGRIYCHQGLFSRFQEQLLTFLEGAPEDPVPLVEDDLFEYVRRAWTGGLDEGATPLFGGPPVRRAPLALGPLVFTNVDVAGGLVRLERPAPILGLCRVASDAEGQRLARAADGTGMALRPQTL